MKKILSSALLLLAGVALFTACSDDNDSNPVLPTLPRENAFVLNTPTFANGLVDLASTETLRLTWSQPDYGFPAAMQYAVQLSVNGNFTTSLVTAEADESGQTHADYAELATAYITPEATISATEVSNLLQRITLWTTDEVPAEQTLTVRILSTINAASAIDTLYSNTVSFKVAPYYVELSDAEPIIWYMVGNCIANGSWSNGSTADIGVSLLPLSIKAGEEYDKLTGAGIITYTGFFPAGGQLKFVRTPGDWNEQLNYTNVDTSAASSAAVTDEDGDNHNIGIPADGVYTIEVNTANNTITVTAYDGTPATYAEMFFTGIYGVWDDLKSMNPVSTFEGAVNHDWWYDLDATAGATEMKFLSDSSWAVNWGSEAFPTGIGAQNGANIPVAAGSYRIIFNDITGAYTFIAKE